jgi:hypothetical protein
MSMLKKSESTPTISVLKSIPNRYYLLTQDKKIIEWDIYNTERSSPDLLWATYCSRVLQKVEQSLAGRGLVFYLSKDELDRLPSYGENVVAIVAGDEWCRIPKYANQVLAVFKGYGIEPFLGCNLLKEPSYTNFVSLLQFLRIWLAYLPGLISYRLQILKNLLTRKLRDPKIYTIPLGYYNQPDTPQKQISERTFDIFFAGSVSNDSYAPGSFKSFIKNLLKPPKIQSRQKMISCLRKFQNEFTDFQVELSLTDGFYSMTEEDLKTYSERLMNSKICLIPRGTSYETYRFFEAIRFGCIPITEALPSHWFYNESPAIEIKNWDNLAKTLERILTNPNLVREKHQQALWWWQNKCSETAVAQYIADKLECISSK